MINAGKGKAVKEALPFILFYGLVYMAMATVGTYLNIYYQEAGYSNTQIGLLASIGSAVSLVALPFWGIISDRTDKRRVLLITVGASAAAALLYPLNNAYLYICLIVLIYTSFNSAVAPVGDAVTLQFVSKRNIKFSNIRLVGTISYAAMNAAVGQALAGHVGRIFYINAAILFAAFLLVTRMPSDKSERAAQEERREKANLTALFKNKMLVCIFLVSFVLGIIMTFYHSFIGLLLIDMGADTGQVGVANALSAACEIPVLFFVERLFGKRKPVFILMFTGLMVGLRMLLLYAGGSVPMVYAASLLHGFNYILPYYFTVILIDKYSPEGLKATAQTVYMVFRGSVAALTGNLGGGLLADMFSLRQVFLILSLMAFVLLFAVPGMGVLIYKWKKSS